MVVEQLVKAAGWERYEVDTAGDRSDLQLRQYFEFLVVRAQSKVQILALGFKTCLQKKVRSGRW